MPTPEQNVVDSIKTMFAEQHRSDTWLLKAVDVPTDFPDLFGAWRGKPIAIEAKAPGKTARPGQHAWITKLRNSGYIAGVVDSKQDFYKLVGLHPLDMER